MGVEVVLRVGGNNHSASCRIVSVSAFTRFDGSMEEQHCSSCMAEMDQYVQGAEWKVFIHVVDYPWVRISVGELIRRG